ncbi:hypothetical protein [Sphingomicrobium nitratireducens]|uniref:hypothetical protein n=1 Tax=Sphingomicrobium nitratireducens TaxID=2964666 RepID=UPI0022401E46|nr:hypothetical protein [Sphingomicrobium nitratireducens]
MDELGPAIATWSKRVIAGMAVLLVVVWIEPSLAPVLWIAAGVGFGALAGLVAAHYVRKRNS